ncbi:prenyltransferase/squalene oxidase repeat-containing protein [Microtetraspora niveoalba]|uniref:prenyltransferase/squalene oxidase repeat-containing protein n=1 Tax=Microtetraspora niveoalba TaxID=46175 RepID=UPI000A0633EB|nr:prenyltransferase/squalene oxidase repeat-containing protein [Microtetraspora niveoalba]
MSIGDLVVPESAEAVVAAADELIAGLMARPWGQVSPSVYETGRLVTLAPWLAGHAERVDFLVRGQNADGTWGAPEGYGLVPTLSATEALLSALLRGDVDSRPEAAAEVAGAADRGLRALAGALGGAPSASGTPVDVSSLPDMPALDVIVPALVAAINEHLDALDRAPGGVPGAVVDSAGLRLDLPPGMGSKRLAAVRALVASGADLPEKLVHALEIAGEAASGAAAVRPAAIGTVGASPAATAAWLGDRGLLDTTDRSLRHLEAVARRHGGPVPVGLPITVFERGWVLSWLARAGIPLDVPPEMTADLRAAIGPSGTPAGPGLPPDADTTSVALYALALLGVPSEPAGLRAFELDTHFCTWPGEDGFSVSVNAHVLDAFGQYALACPDRAARCLPYVRKLSALVRDHQRPDGSWDDRWHASPYYATAACALALGDFGGEEAADAVRRAVRWVLSTQRADGSWGRWEGTAEETAYAMQILLLARPQREAATHGDAPPAAQGDAPPTAHGESARTAQAGAVQAAEVTEAAARGYAYLLESAGQAEDPPLWHDKDLYLPAAIVRAAVLAALHLAQTDPVVMEWYGQL